MSKIVDSDREPNAVAAVSLAPEVVVEPTTVRFDEVTLFFSLALALMALAAILVSGLATDSQMVFSAQR